MMRSPASWTVAAVLWWLASLPGPAASAISPANVLVLVNTASLDSILVAIHYGQAYPGVRFAAVSGVSAGEEISADEYLTMVRPQVLAALDSSIDVIVTTKGLPLRIALDGHTNPGTYTDPFGVERTVYSTTWKNYSSLESELARIDTFSTWQQLGDQTYWLPDGAPGAPHPARNPYYRAADGFDYRSYGIRLTTRLDGFSVADIQASIDRAQHAFVGPPRQTGGPYHFVLDDDPNAQGGNPADRMESLRDDLLSPRQLPVTYDGSDTFLRTAPGPVLGYVTHGVHGGAPRDYLVDRNLGVDFDLADGAVFHSHESYNARSFDPDSGLSQGLVAEWLARGGTAGTGHVEEPLSGPMNVTNEDWMFAMLLDGYTWAEAAWSATAQLSYVNTVVGDPLMVYRQLLPGDANRDGLVGASDAALVNAQLGRRGQPGGTLWTAGDFNADGRINAGDLALLSANWGATANWLGATIWASGPALAAVPEPSSRTLWLAGPLAWFLLTQNRRPTGRMPRPPRN